MLKKNCWSSGESWSYHHSEHFETTCITPKLFLGYLQRVDSMLIKAIEISTCPEWNKDEVHVREGLVCDKHWGELIGFTNLGNVNSHLDAFEQALSSNSEHQPPLAKSVMVFMVRWLFSKLQFAYAQFPWSQVRGDKLYHPFWEAVCQLENCGLKVCT